MPYFFSFGPTLSTLISIYFCILISANVVFAAEDADTKGLQVDTQPPIFFDIEQGIKVVSVAMHWDRVKNSGATTLRDRYGGILFGGFALSDYFAFGVSYEPEFASIDNSETGRISDRSQRLIGYIIPVLWRSNRHQISSYWGIGRQWGEITFHDEKKIFSVASRIGYTALLGRFALSKSFSMSPWLAWKNLLIDPIDGLQFNTISWPESGIDTVFHFPGGINLTFSVIFKTIVFLIDEQRGIQSRDDRRRSFSFGLSYGWK